MGKEVTTRELAGGCLCGAVRYRCPAGPKPATYCHCPDCRRTTGSAFNVGVVVAADALEIVCGRVKGYTKTAESGNRITRQFCPECGSPLFTRVDASPGLVWIKAGSLDEPEWVKPTHQVWTEMAVAWGHIDAGLPSYPRGGPVPEEAGS